MSLTIPPVPAADLAVGDRLAAGLILGGQPGDILFAHTYELKSTRWTFLACRIAEGLRAGDVEAVHFMADALIRLEARADTGLVDETEPAPVHLVFVVGDTACGIMPERTTDISGTSVQADVTCEGCRDVLPPDSSTLLADHEDALDEDNERDKARIVADMRFEDGGRIANPNLARFLAHREDKRREARRVLGLEESAKHYPADRRTCVDPGEPEHDHAMCEDVVAEDRERLLAAADTVSIPAEDATLTQLREPGSAERAARLAHAKETYA